MADATPTRRRLVEALFHPVDISSLVFFRIAFGAVMLWEVTRYYEKGWIRGYWIDPEYNFPYPFFDWVTPWPGLGMYYHFILMGAMALCVMLGLLYRVSAALLFLSFTYIFLLEEARYLNHFYLVCLVAFLMIWLPAHRNMSLDARFKPELRSRTVPAWTIWLLRFQIGIPYFYGGIAKINHDWLNGAPMRYWLAERDDFPVVGHLFHHPFAAYFFSYSGLLIDLVAVPLLLWRRTRVAMFVVLMLFHFTNTRLFNIGIFPWLMLGATTIFFPPDWPRRLLGDLRSVSAPGIAAVLGAVIGGVLAAVFRGSVELIPCMAGALGGAVSAWSLAPSRRKADDSPLEEYCAPGHARLQRLAVVGALAIWTSIQILVPLRHFLIPGVVHWTEEGHRFAWHMKLRGKDGRISYEVTNPASGEVRVIDPSDELESWQIRKMSTRPYMIQQYAERLAERLRNEGWQAVEVRARSEVKLNGRPWATMIDTDADLVAVDVWFDRHNDWITHLETPLRIP